MSTRAMAWAWTVSTSTPSERLVLLALADHAGHDGYCWPGGASLAQKTGLSEQSVRRYITMLEERGLLVKLRRRRRKDGTLGTWVYELRVDQPVLTGDLTTDNRLAVDQCSPISSQESFITEPSIETLVHHEVIDEFDLFDETSRVENSDRLRFEQFWSVYPRKTAKKAALTKWSKMSSGDRTLAVERLADHIAYWNATGTGQRFIPHASTWLNQERFNDKLDKVDQSANGETLFEIMAPWFERRGFLSRLNRSGVVTAIEILLKWNFGPGEIAIRMAALSRSHLDQIILPRTISAMTGFARFQGHPRMQDESGLPDYQAAMERAYQNQGWS